MTLAPRPASPGTNVPSRNRSAPFELSTGPVYGADGAAHELVSRAGGSRHRREGQELVLARPDDHARRLRHLVPGAGQVAQRLGDDQPCLRRRAGAAPPARGGARSSVDTSVEKKSERELTLARVPERPRWSRRRWWPRSSARGPRSRARRPVARRRRPRGRLRSPGRPTSPKVSARKKSVSESVDPSMSGVQRGVDRRAIRSRFSRGSPASEPLCIHSQFSNRNGWQLLRCTGVPVEARMWANISRVRIWPDTSRRFASFHAGSTLLKTAGRGPSPYQPIPKPSPFVVVAPSRECRLWSISECTGRNSRSVGEHGVAGVRHPSAHGRH